MKMIVLIAVLVLGGCATGIDTAKYNAHSNSPDSFSICHGYSCTHKTDTGFTPSEWHKIAAIFKINPAKNNEQERSKIAMAIGMMEGFVGAKIGTSADMIEASRFKENQYQLDCIDETVNTSQYLAMLHHAKLLRFYRTYEPTHRGYFIDGRWPHNTAVIKDVSSGALWVVDSFYRVNGESPYIVPREDWLSGWRPVGATQ